MKYLRKNEKGRKKILKANQRPDGKRMIFYIFFFGLMWSNGLENSVNSFGLTLKAEFS